MYKLIRNISVFLRTFIFLNPFEKYIELYLQGTILMNCASQLAYLFNLCVGGIILWIICYPLTGIIYNRGECPVIGSIIFCILVLINSWILTVICSYSDELKIGVFIFQFSLCLIGEVIVLCIINRVKIYLNFI